MALLPLLAILTIVLLVHFHGRVSLFVQAVEERNATVLATCRAIEGQISRQSDVAFPLLDLLQYQQGTEHFMTSSSQAAECVFFPGTPEDVAIGLRAIAASCVPFAVKGGGHASNPGRALGGQEDVEIGAGLVWDDVYRKLENTGVNVVGGRVSGVGVAGFILGGGGYSWLSNEHGLTIDTVEAFHLVLPDGTISTVTATDEDLFFALKGGQNHFGIVTSFILRTVPQPPRVFGGIKIYTADKIPALLEATERFSANSRDPKAAILPTINHLLGDVSVTVIYFYNGPSPPASTFADFAAIIPLVASVKRRSFISHVTSSPASATADRRGLFHTVSLLEYSGSLLRQISNHTTFYGEKGESKSGFFISYDVRVPASPFYQELTRRSTDRAIRALVLLQVARRRVPHSPSRPLLPLNIYFAWNDPRFDTYWRDAARESAATLTAQAIAEGQAIEPEILYPNYSLADTPLDKLYGAENLARLREIKARVDPTRLMDLAGGFKL